MPSRFDIFFPALRAGLMDGLNPCGMATALIFLVIVSLFGYTLRYVISLGLVFFLGTGAVHFLSAMGALDGFLNHPDFTLYVPFIYSCMAPMLIVMGVLDILDWGRYNRSLELKCFRLPLPIFLRDGQVKRDKNLVLRVLRNIIIVVMALIVAVLMTFAGLTFPKSEYIFIVHSFSMSGGNTGFVYQSYFLYSLAMVLPVIILWITAGWLSLKREKGVKTILYYKGISSALFLATGIMMAYFFVRQS